MLNGGQFRSMTLESLMAEGIAAIERGDRARALHCFARAQETAPEHLGALKARAWLLTELGRLDEAAECLRRCSSLCPHDAYSHFQQGLLHARQQRFAEALPCLARCLAIEPDHVDALLCLGIALHKLQRFREAESCLARAVAIDPLKQDAWLNRGLVLGQLERHKAALEAFERVLAARPAHPQALLNRSVALGKLGRHREALDCAERAAGVAPGDAGIQAQLGFALAQLNRHEEALLSLERALAIEPGHPDAGEHRGFVCLALGRLAEGFQAREARWLRPPLRGTGLQTVAPLWLGSEPLAGRSILLQHEQGFGDTIQFVRYAPLVAQRGASVILRVPLVLQALLEGMPGVAAVVSEAAAPPAHDFHCPMMSLPLALGTRLETIPAQIPYLRVDPLRQGRWRQRLGPHDGRLRIGIAWAGRQYGGVNSPRDMQLAALAPLLELDAEFVCLQKEIPAGDLHLLEALPRIRRLGETVEDFADTAALIAQLDLVVAVDTAVVHLAGAIGRPVWMMNRHASCWRWLRCRRDSPWYPSLRIFRQGDFGDWPGVVAEVRAALLRKLEELRPAAYSSAAYCRPSIA